LNVNTGTVYGILEGHGGSVFDEVFSPNGLHLASVSSDKAVRIWSVKTGATTIVLKGHSE
jgi:WD40 repeat protein